MVRITKTKTVVEIEIESQRVIFFDVKQVLHNYIKRFPRYSIWFISLQCNKYRGNLATGTNLLTKILKCVLVTIIANNLSCCACILPYK